MWQWDSIISSSPEVLSPSTLNSLLPLTFTNICGACEGEGRGEGERGALRKSQREGKLNLQPLSPSERKSARRGGEEESKKGEGTFL